MELPGIDAHQRRMIISSIPENWRLRGRWMQAVEDALRPIRHPLDAEVMSAIRRASERISEKA